MCSPETVDAKLFEEVKNLLINHLEPQPIKFAQRYKFHSIVQTEGQSACDFISKLRTVGEDCEFSNFDEALLDRILVGLRDFFI